MKFILILFFVNLINSEEVNKVYYGNWSTPANKYFGPFYNNAGFLIVNNYIDQFFNRCKIVFQIYEKQGIDSLQINMETVYSCINVNEILYQDVLIDTYFGYFQQCKGLLRIKQTNKFGKPLNFGSVATYKNIIGQIKSVDCNFLFEFQSQYDYYNMKGTVFALLYFAFTFILFYIIGTQYREQSSLLQINKYIVSMYLFSDIILTIFYIENQIQIKYQSSILFSIILSVQIIFKIIFCIKKVGIIDQQQTKIFNSFILILGIIVSFFVRLLFFEFIYLLYIPFSYCTLIMIQNSFRSLQKFGYIEFFVIIHQLVPIILFKTINTKLIYLHFDYLFTASLIIYVFIPFFVILVQNNKLKFSLQGIRNGRRQSNSEQPSLLSQEYQNINQTDQSLYENQLEFYCIICLQSGKITNKNLQELDENDGFLLQCFHKYHFKCIKRWLNERQYCPNCRQDASEIKKLICRIQFNFTSYQFANNF